MIANKNVVRVTDIHFQSGGQYQRDALCLGDKLMKLAYEILEDEPCAPALPRAPQCTDMERDIGQMYARVWRKLCKLE